MGKRVKDGGRFKLTRKVRLYLYGVLLAASPLAIGYGLLTESEVGNWLTLAGAVLAISNGVALGNVPPKEVVENADN